MLRLGLDGWSNKWTVTNKFGAQQASLRILALSSVMPYDTSDALVVADFSHCNEFRDKSAPKGIRARLSNSAIHLKAGKTSGLFSAENSLGTRSGAWAMVGKRFDPEENLSLHPALGVWIYGDGKGEVLNFQLLDARGPNAAVDDRYVIVNFQGWRYWELVEPEAKRWSEYRWPYQEWLAAYTETVDLRHLTNLNLYYNNLPQGEDVTCWLSPIKALEIRDARLKNPQITLGGKSITFPIELTSDCYIEYTSPENCSIFDRNGSLLRKFRPEGQIPTLIEGKNSVEFSWSGPAGMKPRVLVTVIASGPSLVTQHDQSTTCLGSTPPM